MRSIKEVSEKAGKLLKAEGMEKYVISVSESEKREISWDNGKFSLFRTVMSNGISMKGFREDRVGSVSGNDISDEGISALISDLSSAVSSSVPDSAHNIAEKQDNKVFSKGSVEFDMDLLFSRLSEFQHDVNRLYPQIVIMNISGIHVRFHAVYSNSNGTVFEKTAGYYCFGIEFSASDGETSNGLDYADISTFSLDKPFIEMGGLKKQFEDCVLSLKRVQLSGKFTGTVILTPSCFTDFLYMISSVFLTDGVILDGTSLWLDSVGKQVADKCLNVSLTVSDPRITDADEWTGDGYLAEDIPLIENGILRTHLIGLYTANKTGRPVTKNADFSVVVQPGNSSLSEMISSVKEGLIVGSFSGGAPSGNGEFSGVVKNGFYIKDGKIQGSVLETMINGNLDVLLKNLTGLSSEVECRGSYVVPYASFSDILITTK